MKEKLVTCLLCGITGFSARGLRSHWCEAKGPSKNSRHSTPLTKDEWETAVFHSNWGPFAVVVGGMMHHWSASHDQIRLIHKMPIGQVKMVLAGAGAVSIGVGAIKAAEVRLRQLQKGKTS